MDCTALAGAAGSCGGPQPAATHAFFCADHRAASSSCGALPRASSYADVVRLPPPPPAAPPRRPSIELPDGDLMGRPRAVLPFSQLTLGGKTTAPWHAGAWRVRACSIQGDVLRVEYPKGSSNFDSGGPEGGCTFKARPRCLPATDVSLVYRVRFPDSFDWGRGGKLPGLFVGVGEAAGGQHSANAASCRLMWQAGGGVIAYVYPPAGVKQTAAYARAARQGDTYGDGLFAGEGLRLVRGDRWNDIVVRVKLNTFDGQGRPLPDGLVTVSVNQEAATFGGIIWRRRRDIRVNHIAFSTFFGGKWKSPRDTYAEFKGVSCIT